MMSATKTIHIILILFFAWAATSCSKGSKSTSESSSAFFESSNYYMATLVHLSPDSIVKRIKEDVPSPLSGYTCEGVYYRLDESTSDSILLRYLDLCEQYFPHDSVLVVTQGLRGQLFVEQNRFDTALVCLKVSESLAEKLHSAHRIADAKYYLGKFYSRRYDYPQAVKMLHEAYNMYATLPESLINGQQFECLLGLGSAYRGANDFASAQIWDKYAWHLAQILEAQDYKIRTSAAVANNYLNTHQLDSAKILIDSAFYFHNLYGYNTYLALHYRILGQIQVAQGNCAAALPNLLQARKKNLQPTDSVTTLRYDEALADAYLCLGRLDSAIYWYQKALTTPDPMRQMTIHAQLGKAYFQSGNQALAYKHEMMSKNLSEKVFTKEKDKALGRLEAKNELDTRESQVVAQENKAKITRLLMKVALVALFIFLGIGLFWGYRKRQEGQVARQEKDWLYQENKRIEAREWQQKQALERTQQALVVKETALEDVTQELTVKETTLEKITQQLGLKNLFVEELEMKLTLQDWQTYPSVSEEIDKEKLQNLKILTKEDWLKFRKLFSQHSPHFIKTLHERFPKLTDSEIRLVLLIKLQFDVNEIASVLGIESASVYKSRYRLRHKLDLSEADDLEECIQKF